MSVGRTLARSVKYVYVGSMTVEALKEAIVHLTIPERDQLAKWFDEWQEEPWDQQMEQDFTPDGKGAHLLEQLDRQIVEGDFNSLVDGLELRRQRRTKK